MDPLRDSLSAQAGLLVEMVTAALEPELAAVGITLATFDLLATVRALSTRASQAEVARRLGVTPPTLSESVQLAVKKGLLEQRSDPGDARLKMLRLTSKGNRALEQILAGIARSEAAMIEGIEAEALFAAREVLRRATRNLARSIPGPNE